MSVFNRRVTFFILLGIVISLLSILLITCFFYPEVDADYLATRTGISTVKDVKILQSFGPPTFGEYELHCFISHSPQLIDEILENKTEFSLSVTRPNANHIEELKVRLTQLKEKEGVIEQNFILIDVPTYLAFTSSSIDKGKVINWIVSPSKKYSFISIYAFH